MQGIYFITNVLNGNVYVGSSKNITKRLGAHRRALTNGAHPNPHLQSAWNLYGSAAFKMEAVEPVANEAHLTAVEQSYIEMFWVRQKAYNATRDAERPRLGRKWSPERHAKHLLAMARVKERGGRRSYTPEALENIRAGTRRRANDPAEIKRLRSIAHLGSSGVTEDGRRRRSTALAARVWTEASRAKIWKTRRARQSQTQPQRDGP